jgi:DNA-binding NarL/FixJ family response regulator
MSAKKRPTGQVQPVPSRPAPTASGGERAAKRRLMLVEDHAIMREGLIAIINRQADLEICGEASSPAEALAGLAQAKPDLMLTDLTMPGRSGVEFIRDVQAMSPGLPIVVLSMHDETLYAERALRAGARGYIMKDAGSAKTLEAIRVVLGGQVYVSTQIAARIVGALAAHRPRGSDSPIETLSDREFELFQLVGHGYSGKEIAERMRISPKTVDVHRAHIKRKLNLPDLLALIRYAVRWVETQDGGT